jgi:hypothetical protein
MELAEGLLHILKGRYLVAGIVVLMFSVTNMATACTPGYVANWLESSDCFDASGRPCLHRAAATFLEAGMQ